MTFLQQLGDKAAAIRAYEAFAWRLGQEHELEPSAETQALAAMIRREEGGVVARHAVKRVEPSDAVPVRATVALFKSAGLGRLVRVAAVYLLASVAVLVGVQFTASLFGLPSWFLPVGIVLLLIGLPVILTTAVMHEARLPSAGSGTEPPLSVPQHWFTWRRAILGGVFAFAGLGGMGATVVWLRNRGHVLHEDTVAVMPFHVVGADLDLWREGLVDLMSTALDGTGRYRASDPRAVLNTWRRSLSDAVELPEPDKAAEVARSLDAGHFILGSVIHIAPGAIRIAADLYSTSWLRKEGSATVEGPETDMTSLVDRMTVDLLKSVWSGEELPEVRVSAITTTSIPALKAYLEGEQAFRRSQFQLAQQSFSRAVEADSTFAIALHRLALSYRWSVSLAAPELSPYALAAVRHSRGLPERDSLAILGSKLINVDGDDEAIQLFERLTRLHPDDLEAWYGLGKAYYHFGYVQRHPVTSAIAPFERALALDSSFTPALIHLVELAHFTGDSARALDWTSAYLALDSTSRFATAFRVGSALGFGSPEDSAMAVAILDTVDVRVVPLLCDCGSRGWPLQWTVGGTWSLPKFEVIARAGTNPRFRDAARGATLLGSARHYLRFGQIARAIEYTKRGHALDPSDWRASYAVMGARVMGLVVDSTSQILWDRSPQAAGLPAFWLPVQIYEFGAVAAHSERLPEAQGALDRLESVADSLTVAGNSATGRYARELSWSLRGHIAAARDSVDTAIANLRRGLAMFNGFVRWLRDVDSYLLATLLEMRGAEAEALRIYRTLTTPWVEALGLLRRAQLHERRGELAAALDYYERFVELWDKADPHLQPQVEAARQAMKRLSGT